MIPIPNDVQGISLKRLKALDKLCILPTDVCSVIMSYYLPPPCESLIIVLNRQNLITLLTLPRIWYYVANSKQVFLLFCGRFRGFCLFPCYSFEGSLSKEPISADEENVSQMVALSLVAFVDFDLDPQYETLLQ
jgi:hypothetical protein